MNVRRILKGLAERFGVHVSRTGAVNRFDAVEPCLRRMKGIGYEPQIVIDGGANHGQFYRRIEPIFPDAFYHLIEPQPECAASLLALVDERPKRVRFHGIALTTTARSVVKMIGRGPQGGGTGAFVTQAPESERADGQIEVPATSLDELFRDQLSPEDRTLLKLDLESHELPALGGAEWLLRRTEAILVEVSFYDVENVGKPLFNDILKFLSLKEFELFDIASLTSRPRDQRLRMGDVVFVRRNTPLVRDVSWT